MATKIFQSGFEDSRDGYQCAEGSNCLSIYNEVTNARTTTYMYPSGSSWWIQGKDTTHRPSGAPAVTAHGGSYCLGLARNGSQRCEFQLRQWAWNSYDKWFFRMWLYFPSNWDTTPATSSGWEVLFAFGDSVYAAPQGYPYVDIALWRLNTAGVYTLVIEGRGYSDEGHTYITKPNWTLPRGRWFKFELYFDRGIADANPPTGECKIWMDSDALTQPPTLAATGVYGKQSVNSGAQLEIYPQDLYAGGGGNEYRYVDDMEIWDGMPSETPTNPVLSVNAVPSNLNVPFTVRKVA